MHTGGIHPDQRYCRHCCTTINRRGYPGGLSYRFMVTNETSTSTPIKQFSLTSILLRTLPGGFFFVIFVLFYFPSLDPFLISLRCFAKALAFRFRFLLTARTTPESLIVGVCVLRVYVELPLWVQKRKTAWITNVLSFFPPGTPDGKKMALTQPRLRRKNGLEKQWVTRREDARIMAVFHAIKSCTTVVAFPSQTREREMANE